MVEPGVFFIFSGLPGSGKSTLSARLARRIQAAYFRVDVVEQGLREVCSIDKVEGQGYRLTYRMAQENLKNGIHGVADSVNPWKLCRDEWNEVAESIGAQFINIEVSCSDTEEHRRRVECRGSSVPGLKQPTWQDVLERDYHPWPADSEVLKLDTAGESIEQSFNKLVSELERLIPSIF